MKIGIVTHYHNSTNYGGSLQAYALCRVLEQLGHEARQLPIDHTKSCRNLLRSPVKKLLGRPVWLLRSVRNALVPARRKEIRQKQERKTALLQAFSSFNQGITPHSKRIYTEKTIHEAVADYDAFITGSDQVWNPIWYFPPFFLTFVPQGKKKLSYAASIAQKALPEKVRKRYQKHLESFDAVSVREADAVTLLEGIAPAVQVLDPTLLLESADWAQLAAPRQVKKPYLFCYFLGDDKALRSRAANYAAKKGLTLVTIPHAAGLIHKADRDFGDLTFPDAPVEVFLSLLQHADCVFTDSFHASVFSLIFQRQFFAFPRSAHGAMGSRLLSLTDLFGIPERFLDTEEKAACLDALPPIDYTVPCPDFLQARQTSLAFLRENLEGKT